jgi:hypothetical protein
MINFYRFYNKTGLDKQEYSLLIEKLLDEKYTNEMSIIEPIIKKSPRHTYNYAKYIIRGRWIDGELGIMQSPSWAYLYALKVIKGRWPEAEPVIMTGLHWAYRYAIDIIKGRWKEAEDIILKSDYAKDYCREFGPC